MNHASLIVKTACFTNRYIQVQILGMVVTSVLDTAFVYNYSLFFCICNGIYFDLCYQMNYNNKILKKSSFKNSLKLK